MEDLKVTASAYDFAPARAAMQRYVDDNLLSGISWAVLSGRDLIDVSCVGWADKEAEIPLRTDLSAAPSSATALTKGQPRKSFAEKRRSSESKVARICAAGGLVDGRGSTKRRSR